jgi:glutathione S-transferase
MFNRLFSYKIEYKFLGVQRGHQNTLEIYPQFLLMLGLGSIQYPLISSIGGVIWLLGRLAYFYV